MAFIVNVANERDYFASFEVTDAHEQQTFLAAGRNDKTAIAHFRDLVARRYGPERFASFDLVVNGQWLNTVRRIPYPKG